MSARLTIATCLVAALAIVAACGGTPTSTPIGAAATPSSVPGAATPDSTPEPIPTEATNPGGAIDICALVTADEWASVTGFNVTGAEEVEMSEPFQSCLYPTDTNPVGATTLSPDSGMWNQVWATSASGLPAIAGVGDAAVWDENSASLYLLAGGYILGINAGSGADDLGTRLEWAKALAQIAVGRL